MIRLTSISLVGLVVIGGAALYFWRDKSPSPFVGPPAPPRLHVENYSRIRVGLTRSEVEELLGGPAGNYGQYANGWNEMTCEGYHVPSGSVGEVWCDDANRFEIYFNPHGLVAFHHKRYGYSQGPSFLPR